MVRENRGVSRLKEEEEEAKKKRDATRIQIPPPTPRTNNHPPPHHQPEGSGDPEPGPMGERPVGVGSASPSSSSLISKVGEGLMVLEDEVESCRFSSTATVM